MKNPYPPGTLAYAAFLSAVSFYRDDPTDKLEARLEQCRGKSGIEAMAIEKVLVERKEVVS